MSTRRVAGEPCPIDEEPLGMDKCQPCPFFRGATRMTGKPWSVVCNWPRNGSYIAQVAVPAAFLKAFDPE